MGDSAGRSKVVGIVIINLIKPRQMFSITLPDKVKGRYWITDTDARGQQRELVSIEAADGAWVAKSNRHVTLLDGGGQSVRSIALYPQCFLNMEIRASGEYAIVYVESDDISVQTFRKIVVKNPGVFTIGRARDNDFCFDNPYVSSAHSKLTFDGSRWSVLDLESTNGTYVNGYRIQSRGLNAGDMVYIMGLKLVVGSNFLAVNDPDGTLRINSSDFFAYIPQRVAQREDVAQPEEKQYFFRAPRFHREIEHTEIVIDPPPAFQKPDSVPLAMMLGPSLTMGMASVSTAFFTLNNVLQSGGNISQAMPTMVMAASMLLGTGLWPVLTKNHEKKVRIAAEKKRQEKYLAYLDSIRDRIKRTCKEQSQILEENLISPGECAERIADKKTNLWERTIGQNDFLQLRLGRGNKPIDLDLKYAEKKFSLEEDNLQDAMMSLGAESKELTNVPISISLVDNISVGICGSYLETANTAKSLILQMIALHSYDELKIMLITDRTDLEEWEFVKFIPHFWSDDKSIRFLATDQEEIKELSVYIEKNILSREDRPNEDYTMFRPYYVVISTSKELTDSCEAIQQMLRFKNNRGFSVINIADSMKDLPKETKMVISLDGDRSKLFDRDDTSGNTAVFAPDQVDRKIFGAISEDIANIELDLNSKRFTLPTMLTFLEMFHVSKIEHLNALSRWKENNPTITLQTPVGVDSYGGAFLLDLHEKFHGPHGLVAGMTGSGKSEFIITYILSMAVNYHPDEVAFILIDYKGGGLAGAFEDTDRGIKLPHLAGTITNLDGAAINRSLISIQSELRRRQAIFNEARRVSNEGTMDIYKYQQLYRDKVVSEPVPHLFIISDEFAELKAQQPEFMEQLISAARIGRSLGVHLILATQKPSGVVDDQIWSNSKFRVCLKVQEKADSQEMIKRPDAAELVQTGRFYLQVGFNELFALGQSAWCGAEYVPTETIEKNVDSSVQVVDNIGRVIMNVKPMKKRVKTQSRMKQIVAIVKYLSDLAEEENVHVRPLWLPPIPEFLSVDKLEEKYGYVPERFVLDPVVGEYDDPFNQKQDVLTMPFSTGGNCLIFGSAGAGKAEFLTTLCYSVIKHHSAEEVNIYIMDFGSETLRMLEEAPQVGGVALAADEEKVLNLLKLLSKEIEKRKALFSNYGGDYTGYCSNSGKTLPSILVLVNNFAGFTELFEQYLDAFAAVSRDGPKYGIYFVVTATGPNAVRYRIQQNFKTILCLQMNDPTDYLVVMGKTDGLVPSKLKGRGLVKLEKVFEFQSASPTEIMDVQEYLRGFCGNLARTAASHAKPIPVLPKTVNLACVREYLGDLSGVPVGVAKKSLDMVCVNLRGRVVYPVLAQELDTAVPFTGELAKVLAAAGDTVVVDSGRRLRGVAGCRMVEGDYELFVQELFSEMVTRNNTFKDSGLDPASLEPFGERTYLLLGFRRLYEQLSADGQEKLRLLIEKAEPFYKLHFVLVETPAQLSAHQYEAWFKRHVSGDGLWIGDGVTDQNILKINSLSGELYAEIGGEYGFSFTKGRMTLAKLLTSREEE